MSFSILSLRNRQRVAALVFSSVIFCLALSQVAFASPGAHGPNGEHLDSSNNLAVTLNPKFESFTETYELLGELFEKQLIIYLHDYKSNIPVQDATIELESGELSASAEYSELLKAYALTNETMVALLSKEGVHDIILTVMTEDNGDLLSATLSNIPSEPGLDSHEEEHHHDFPWWTIVLSIIIFGFGFLLGRLKKETKS